MDTKLAIKDLYLELVDKGVLVILQDKGGSLTQLLSVAEAIPERCASSRRAHADYIAERQAQATEYLCTPQEWRVACKGTTLYDGSTAICTLRRGHVGLCIYTVPKQHDVKQGLMHEAQKEQEMAKQKEEMAEKPKKAEKPEKAEKQKGNSEALTKAREAGAEARAEARKRKIKLLAKENPKRVGSAAHKRFALYKSGMTVGEFLEKGGKHADLAYDMKHEYIEVK